MQYVESRLPDSAPHRLGCTTAACSILLTFQLGPLKQGDTFWMAFEGACWVCSCYRMSLSARPALMLQLGDISAQVNLTAFLLWF